MKQVNQFLITCLLSAFLVGCVSNDNESPQMADADYDEAARINTQLGVNYMRQGRYELALEKLERALEQDPKLPDANTAIAIVYGQLGDAKRAEKYYRRAMSLDSKNPDVINNFGVFLCEQGNTEDAERYFMEAISDRRYTTPEMAYTNAGVCAKRVPDPAKAERYFRQALQVNPQFPDALEQMAALSYDRHEYLSARAFLQRFDAIAQPRPLTLLLSVRTERALGDFAAARRYADELRKRFPESDEAYELLSAGDND